MTAGQPQLARADLTAANVNRDTPMLAKCNAAIVTMLQSTQGYADAALACRSAIEYYTRKSGAESSDAGMCFYMFRSAEASERYAFVVSKSPDDHAARRAYVVAQLALNDIVTNCSTQPAIVAAAKRVYVTLQRIEPR
jgi:hypothetical protein